MENVFFFFTLRTEIKDHCALGGKPEAKTEVLFPEDRKREIHMWPYIQIQFIQTIQIWTNLELCLCCVCYSLSECPMIHFTHHNCSDMIIELQTKLRAVLFAVPCPTLYTPNSCLKVTKVSVWEVYCFPQDKSWVISIP